MSVCVPSQVWPEAVCLLHMCVRMRECVCVCDGKCVCEIQKDRLTMCVCDKDRERVSVCVSVCVYAGLCLCV